MITYPDFMTEAELAEYLNAKGLKTSVPTLQKKRLTGGGIPFVKIGTKVRYRKVDVEAWLNNLNPVGSTSEIRK